MTLPFLPRRYPNCYRKPYHRFPSVEPITQPMSNKSIWGSFNILFDRKRVFQSNKFSATFRKYTSFQKCPRNTAIYCYFLNVGALYFIFKVWYKLETNQSQNKNKTWDFLFPFSLDEHITQRARNLIF